MYAHLRTPQALIATAAALAVTALVAAPAHAGTNICTLNSGARYLYIAPPASGDLLVRVQAGPPAYVEIVDSQGDSCTDGGGPIYLSQLDEIAMLSNVNVRLDLSVPFHNGTNLIDLRPNPGDQASAIITTGNSGADQWAALGSWPPSLDLDGNAEPDVFVAGSSLQLATGAGNDTIDLSQVTGTPLGSAWPHTLMDGGAGTDGLFGGVEPDTIYPGDGTDTVITGPTNGHPSNVGDHVFLTEDGVSDVITGDTHFKTSVDWTTSMSPLFIQPNVDAGGTLQSGSSSEVEGGIGDRISQIPNVVGGDMDDTLKYPPGSWLGVSFDGELGTDAVDYSNLDQAISAYSTYVTFTDSGSMSTIKNIEEVIGTNYGDTINLAADDLRVRPGMGDDTVAPTGSDQTMVAEPVADGADSFSPPEGAGTWDYSTRTDALTVTLDDEANDGLVGEGDNVPAGIGLVLAGAGADTLYGDAGANRLSGGPGSDTIAGRGGADFLGGDPLGDPGAADTLLGGSGDDTLEGRAGNDTIDGGQGDDEEWGGTRQIPGAASGNDTFRQGGATGDNGSDFMRGGDGTDTVTYKGRAAGVTLTRDTNYNDGAKYEGDRIALDIESLIGTATIDSITGSAEADTIKGLGGADKLFGLAGNDKIYARDGVKDTVACSAGTDSVQRDTVDAVTGCESTF